jgi:2-polyprenyl-3-methyl-5-hydroxy-6-metoxy-1,4-benzoquinol methylase
MLKARDGSSYYAEQSRGRGIGTIGDVERHARFEQFVFDRVLRPHLSAVSGGIVYEAATGPGILQWWLRARGFRNVEGSDFSSTEIELAKMINPALVQGDSVGDLETRFSKDSLGAIVALDFYEHLPREDFRRFLSVAFSRLAGDGILILRGPNADSPLVGSNLYNDVTHVWAYTTVCLTALLRIAGFSHIWFMDDTRASLHRGRLWKLPLMIVSQNLLTALFWSATRVKINYWGSSLYVYAQKRVP